jgi:hypothetical protein
MKSAVILSKTDDLYDKLEDYLRNHYDSVHGSQHEIIMRSIRLAAR